MKVAKTSPLRSRATSNEERSPKAATGVTKDAIVDAALRIFARDTFAGASLQDIAHAAGVAQPLIHYHFCSKEKLWHAAVDHAWGDIERSFRTMVASTVDLEPIDIIKVLCRSFVQFCARYPENASIILNEMRVPGDRFKWLVETYVGPIHDHLDSLILRATEKKQIKPIPPVHLTTTILIAIAHFFSVKQLLAEIYHVDPLDPEVVDAHANYVIEMIFHGIQA